MSRSGTGPVLSIVITIIFAISRFSVIPERNQLPRIALLFFRYDFYNLPARSETAKIRQQSSPYLSAYGKRTKYWTPFQLCIRLKQLLWAEFDLSGNDTPSMPYACRTSSVSAHHNGNDASLHICASKVFLLEGTRDYGPKSFSTSSSHHDNRPCWCFLLRTRIRDLWHILRQAEFVLLVFVFGIPLPL